MEEFNVGVIGAGHVGLVTGVCLAHIGHRVTLVDVNEERVAALERREVPIYEPVLEVYMARSANRLRFTSELAPVVREADVVFIAVDTPQSDDGSAELSSVAAVARGVGWALSGESRKRPLDSQQEHCSCGLRRLRLDVDPGGGGRCWQRRCAF